ncbi:MAG: DNA repair protein RecO [Rhodanobacter sp.]|jgi:DNA repair protein RecO (recombination protein O)|nr:DNA repair protein RecO [Rhodanobacter sp.]
MRVERQPAFILHARPYRETSLLIDAFSRDYGRIGLVARGVRRERSRLSRGMLQPLQPLLLDWWVRGELGTLIAVEAPSAPIALPSETLFCAFYVNELVLRLSQRNDTHTHAFAAYSLCLARMAEGAPVGWTLRRFERDLLADLGYALALKYTADGQPIQADATYTYDPEAGPLAISTHAYWPRVSGAALLALDRDEIPSAEHLAQLRGLARAVVRQLAGNLNTWSLAGYSAPSTAGASVP